MRLELGLHTKLALQQKLVLAPQIIQSIEILQLPAINLIEYVEQQLIENEAIELEMADRTDEEETPPEAKSEDASETRDADLVQEFMPEDWETFKPRRVSAGERDHKLEALKNTAARAETVQDSLAGQLGLRRERDPRIAELARILVYNLDDDGLLPPHRFLGALLESTDEHGYLLKPLKDVVASVDGVAAVKIPTERSGATPEQILVARERVARNVQEAQEVLAILQHVRAMPGGAGMCDAEIVLLFPLVDILRRESGDWTLDEAEVALDLVQSLEPKGVAGRTTVESLLLQLDRDDLLYPEKRRLLEEHLEDVKKNRLQKVARDMGLELDDVLIILGELKSLDLRPAARLSTASARTVHPDVVVEETEEGFQVELVNSYLPPLQVSRVYVEIANSKAATTEQREKARKKVESARWLIDAIAQRQSTLRRVSDRIFSHQQEFLRHGENALRPLKMQTVADALGIHVSTVSRAIADKWVQTPQGIMPLKFFFSGGTETAGGGVESRHAVKNRVKDVIDGEDPQKPLSDDDVASILRERGLGIARRTVTKYRKQLGIPSSRQRRQWVAK